MSATLGAELRAEVEGDPRIAEDATAGVIAPAVAAQIDPAEESRGRDAVASEREMLGEEIAAGLESFDRDVAEITYLAGGKVRYLKKTGVTTSTMSLSGARSST